MFKLIKKIFFEKSFILKKKSLLKETFETLKYYGVFFLNEFFQLLYFVYIELSLKV